MIFVKLNGSEVDELQKRFDSLTFSEQKSAIRGVLTQSAGILKKQTVRNINAAPFKKSEDMEGYDGVKHKVRLMSVNHSFATVYLWSWNRIFEGGTVLRTTKKGYDRGTIKGYHFFKNAKLQTEDKIFATIENNFYKRIERSWNRKQK